MAETPATYRDAELKSPQTLRDKVAIVTGGSRGIGRGIAIELARRGADVLITYASAQPKADEVVQTIQQLGRKCVAIQAAGSDSKAPRFIVERSIASFGPVVDIIINNAAASGEQGILSTTNELFEEQVNTNLRFPLFLIKEAVPYFGTAPRIVNMSSIYARSGHADCLVYSACKGAMESATRSLARELGQKYNATVNCVNPGPVNTDLWAQAVSNTQAQQMWEPQIRNTPAAARVAELDDIAQIVAFLSEEGSRWTTGSVVNANGGMLFV